MKSVNIVNVVQLNQNAMLFSVCQSTVDRDLFLNKCFCSCTTVLLAVITVQCIFIVFRVSEVHTICYE